jgi:hypothetical protein
MLKFLTGRVVPHPSQPCLRLFIARQHVVGAFPRAQEIERAEFLHQLDRFVDHFLLLVVVAHFNKAGDGEVLAQRMTVKAIIGQDAAQVRVAGEQDAVQVEGFALEPVGGRKHVDRARHRRVFVGHHLHADAGVLVRAQQVVDHVETLLARRIVDAADVDEADKRQLGSSRRKRSTAMMCAHPPSH